jgi:hypothetical protein
MITADLVFCDEFFPHVFVEDIIRNILNVIAAGTN